MSEEKILKQIEKDIDQAEQYLIAGPTDKSKFSRAVVVVEKNISAQGQLLISARRESEKKKYGNNKRKWVIKTQFIYNKLAEAQGIENNWLSESKIKREWRRYVFLVAEVAARL